MPDPETENCSRCEGALDTDGYPLWCKACRAKWQREYQALRKQMATGRGFFAGAEAMRRAMAAKLGELPSWTEFNAQDVVQWIAEFPAPRPQ